MTGIPATNMAAFSLNLPAGKAQAGSAKNMEQSFADIMNGSGSQTEAPAGRGKIKASANASESEKQPIEKAGSSRAGQISDEKAEAGKTSEKLSPKESGQVEETAAGLKEEIADAMDVTVEELEEAMEVLGLSLGELANPINLAKLTAEMVEEMDGLTLVTDEAAFEGLKELSGQVTAAVEELAGELGMRPEEIVSMLEEAAAARTSEGNEQPEKVLVPSGEEPLAHEELTEEVDNKVDNKVVKAFQMPTEEEASDEIPEEVPDEAPAEEEGKGYTTKHEIKYATIPEETSVKEAEPAKQQASQEGFKDNSKQPKDQAGLARGETAPIQQQAVFVEGKAAASAEMEAPLPTVDPQSILNQIGEAVRVTGGEDFTSMEMQLHPESLGTLHLQVRAKEGVITAQFTTESETVKQVLEAQVIQLREKLENQGVKVEAVEVLVASHEFERNLEKGSSQEKNAYEAKKVTRRRINLNVPEGEETELTEEEKDAVEIQKDMMERNGNTLDYMV